MHLFQCEKQDIHHIILFFSHNENKDAIEIVYCTLYILYCSVLHVECLPNEILFHCVLAVLNAR